MARIVEWQLPYTWGTGVDIDANKVISVLLREENNLIKVNNDNELYTDLQLAVNIEPTDDLPVWVTVWKVLEEDWWTQNWLLLNRKTTSWDYARWIYWGDGKIYFDWGTGTWTQVYYSSEVDALFTAFRNELATVAFTWDYNDLRNRPDLSKTQPDWAQDDSTAPDYIKNKPTIWDATLSMAVNNNVQATFTANDTDNATFNVIVPTKTSDITNDWDGTNVFVTKTVNNLDNYTLSTSLATVATSGSYADLSNKPTIWDATITVQKNWTAVDTFTTNATSNKSINITMTKSDVWLGNVDNTSDANKPISTATQGAINDLQWQINDLKALGKFLSLWDASTWLPISFPEAVPYTYSTWDYYLVETVGTGTNYRPNWASYTWTASSTAETDELEVWDLYIYDGTTWLLQINHWKTVSFANLAGQPSDNTALANALNAKANSSDLATVATSWAYSDLSWTPVLATVATSGSYDDLTNKPTIPAWQVQSDWTQTTTTAVDYIKNKPTLATVATSWSYNDLSNKPTIPTVNNATLTIQQNGTNVQTFTANASSNVTANITVPTKVSDLNNDSWFITKSVNDLTYYTPTSSLATVATTGSYTDLSNTPTIPTVNDTTITFTQWGVSKGDISLNQSSAETIALDAGFTPWWTATTWYVVTKTADGYEWKEPTGWISLDTNSPITVSKLRVGTEAQYSALGSYSDDTIYMTV